MACGGAVEGPASDITTSSEYEFSPEATPLIGWSGVEVRYSTALRGLGGVLSIRCAKVGSLSYKTSSGGENDQTLSQH